MGHAAWIALAVLVFGLVAFMPIPQMIWGGPKVEVEFARDEQGNLFCSLYNRPISNRFLRWIRVQREQARITFAISIQNAVTNAVVLADSIQSALIDGRVVLLQKVELPPSHLPLTTRVVEIRDVEAGAYDSKGHWMPLAVGSYRMDMTVMAAELKPERQRQFAVTAKRKDTYWADA